MKLPLALCLVAALVLAVGAAAQTPAGPPPGKAKLALVPQRTAFEPGGEAGIAAVLTIERGWHVNSHRPTFEYLIPTTLELTPPDGWEVLSVEYPEGELKTFAFESEPLSVYEGRVAILARLAVPADGAAAAAVGARLRYQACDDRSCLPPTVAEASVELAVGPGGAPVEPALFERAGPVPASAPASGWLLLLPLAVVGGLILNAMPCVLPVLSLKLFGLVKSAGEGRAAVISGALATAAGILFSFLMLALAAIVARAAGAAVGWGVQFQQPVFVAALTVVVVFFCLNLWGLFEIPMPGFATRVPGGASGNGFAGHFGSGLFATLMATPCSAPFLGTSVGFALSQNAGTILAIFAAVGLGMALPYLALAATPASVAWLPRPGPWMLHFKVVMGFLLAGTAVWLLYVLSSQMSRERLAAVQIALLLLALAVWIRSRGAGRAWKGIGAAGVLAVAVATVAIAAGAVRPDAAAAATTTSKLIPWTEFDRAEAERLVAGGSLVFVDVTADWCFTCKVNERLVLETPEVAAAFERWGVVPMKADWTNRSDAIANFLADHGRYGIPFYLLYRPGAEPHLFGELLTKDGLLEVVERAGRALGEGAA